MVLTSGDVTDGYWTYTIPEPRTETTLVFTITASDAAGNEANYGPHEVQWTLINFDLTLWPMEGYGDTTVSGTGFAHNSIITLTWNDQSVPTAPVIITTDENGAFTAIIDRLFLETTPGSNTVKAVDEYGNSKVTTFTVLEAPQGETGTTGEPGQALSSGYFAGMLLLVIAVSFLASFATSGRRNEDELAS
jgi:hypothetical protein